MTKRFSTQSYLWNDGQWVGCGPIKRLHAATHHDAAMSVLGVPVATAGPVCEVALMVWETGRAKCPADIIHFWKKRGPTGGSRSVVTYVPDVS